MKEEEAKVSFEFHVILLLSNYFSDLQLGNDYEPTTLKYAEKIAKIAKHREKIAASEAWDNGWESKASTTFQIRNKLIKKIQI